MADFDLVHQLASGHPGPDADPADQVLCQSAQYCDRTEALDQITTNAISCRAK